MTQQTPPGGAVVTGAGRGLGKEIARLLAHRGHHVLVTDVDADLAAETAAEIGHGATSYAVDVRDRDQVDAARDLVVEQAGSLDTWVNNAGVLVTGPAWEQSADTHRLMLEVNGLGTVNGTVAAIEAMRERGGHIVNIVSLAGLTAVPGEAVYAASKHAAIGFSLSTMADLRLAGIDDVTISCICPDGIWTPMLHDKLDDPASALSFSGKLLQPDEVVAAVASVLDRPRLVTTLPGWRGVVSRLADLVPPLGLRAAPLVVAQGRRTQRRLLAQGGPKK
ncbi:SDR family NAD(P)-dependent oxidoreductase [Nocardioides sp. AE5]|uniref:SDR family oxidoreductase n=1 Tax=Nocardioides sp. AE5 TaxID=2962573 RepID=UPI0028828C24|nr:SDR family NAD(P)-dependent oxidoreductase [Nocardioides sp. AE5]MDT0202938.1 SDR family NAD(P)-dependent oxidoreductase [Nocardioides sp. AE5]